jgi:ABC-2 type transport system permease protein
VTGIAISSVITDIHGFQLIVNFFVFPIFFLSGAIFPVSEFPGIVETIARLSPFTYGVDLVRFSMVNLSLFDPLVDVIVIFLYLFLMLSIASYLFSRTEVR